ncbi:hypothetical protein MKY82_32940 [Paenibacillus sp. FSL W7-1279]|uniref:hypothetical protein n=1 Tax=Paenibacillus TaxID=44249 RepID=UPI001C7D5077|nr:hypothetical protein [Paenibacillus lautus]MBX4151935.1 hypothetical protein [Paenibacillus lautus]
MEFIFLYESSIIAFVEQEPPTPAHITAYSRAYRRSEALTHRMLPISHDNGSTITGYTSDDSKIGMITNTNPKLRRP